MGAILHEFHSAKAYLPRSLRHAVGCAERTSLKGLRHRFEREYSLLDVIKLLKVPQPQKQIDTEVNNLRHQTRLIQSKLAMLRQSASAVSAVLRPSLIRSFSQSTRMLKAPNGASPEIHTTNKKDELDVQSSASKGGKRDRVADDKSSSSAASERDKGNNNEKAKKDYPEAPGPVIGMNDERGGVRSPSPTDLS